MGKATSARHPEALRHDPPSRNFPRFRAIAALLVALLWLGWFSPEIRDSDFWWHLKTGQFLLENHRLPVPDPFAFTTAHAGQAYPGEAVTRHFNLTHEWLAQVVFYLVWRVTGFPGVVFFRALLLTAFCTLAGLIVWRRTGGFYRSLAAASVTATMAIPFALDRPYLFTFLFLAATILILESRRWLALLPAIFLVWANCHGGFFLGWVVLAAYGAEALWQRKDARRLIAVVAVSILVSGLNPNGFRILEVLRYYRSSYLTSKLLEWARPAPFDFSEFTLLWIATALVLLWSFRRVRLADWLLFAAFAAAAFSAQRNLILLGLIAPIILATYIPWKPALRPAVEFAIAAVLACAAMVYSWPSSFNFRAAEWRYPAGATDFLLAHHITGPIFNTYEYGGYLIWRLWPEERVFIDGRSLSESVFRDYGRILYNVEEGGGVDAQQLLDRYGIETIVMNTFEYSQGLVYRLAPALADPAQKEWKLVYNDATAIVLMRHPPDGVTPLDSLQILTHMEAECSLHLINEPQFPACARALSQVFLQVGDQSRARRWNNIYHEQIKRQQ